MLKKLSMAVISASVCGLASAGTMGPVCEPGNVTVPCAAQQWDLGVQALYLQSVVDADKAYGDPVTLNNVHVHDELNNNWDWGVRVEGSYHFNTGNDVTMTWVHYNSSAKTYDLTGNILGAIPNQSYNLLVSDKFDQVNFVFGQHVDVGMFKNIRFYGGLQYADIQMDASNYFAHVPAPLGVQGVTSVVQYHDTDFNGLGPVVGMDYSYDVTSNFSLTANGAVSVLYGSGRFRDGFVLSDALVSAPGYGSMRMMVPSVEMKLGANYGYQMETGMLNLEAGYMAVNYFNALQTRGVNPVGAGFPTNSDYGLYGPYFGLKWVGNA